MSITTISWKDLEQKELVSKGPYKKIYRGRWAVLPEGKNEVAIKKWCLKSCPPHLENEFVSSGQLLTHPHIVTTHGICFDPGNLSLITELLFQSLCQLHKNLAPTRIRLDLIINQRIMSNISSAVLFLHSKGISNLCLKSPNILLSEDLTKVKICDMGLNYLKLESSSSVSAKESSVRWRSGRSFTRGFAALKKDLEVRKEEDIYAYGMVLWELFKGHIPYVNSTEQCIIKLLNQNVQEPIADHCPLPFRLLYGRCVNLDAKTRPTAAQLESELKRPELDSYFRLREKGSHIIKFYNRKQGGYCNIAKNIALHLILMDPEFNYKLNF